MPTKSMKAPLGCREKLNYSNTIIGLGSLTVHGLIPPHMVHLRPTSHKSQVNNVAHSFFAQNV